ncbi:YkgJ family cysteine cluster protein [Prosthecobacter sp. SYSU 5D2]|uniref:YkgJ family cysteine cluster protein n=1 Tax=Prosthecobacter sp. SYSU 5D2 TaxID=3134134 RepID=UPI0031FF0903
MSDPDSTAAASRLCTACGMCCNGVLFHIVRLQPVDSVKALEALGMKLSRKKREPYFNQPCRFLNDCTCTIYESRPQRCRLFECRQILGLQAGDIAESEAEGRIAEVRALVRQVEALLEAHGNMENQRPLLERCTQLLQQGGETQMYPLRHAMQGLNDLLNLHFRPEPVALNM